MCMSMICGYNTESEHDDSDSEPSSKRTQKIIGICVGKYICIIIYIISIMDHNYTILHNTNNI